MSSVCSVEFPFQYVCIGFRLQTNSHIVLAVVFNVITHSKAYCLYPKATLLERRTLFNDWCNNSTYHNAVSKYTARGWTFVHSLKAEEHVDPFSAFSSGPRRMGDSKSWTITFSPVNSHPSRWVPPCHHQSVDHDLEIDTWFGGTDGYLHFRNNAYIYHSERLSRGFMIGPSLHLSEFVSKFTEIKRKYPDQRYESRLLLPITISFSENCSRYLDCYLTSIYGS